MPFLRQLRRLVRPKSPRISGSFRFPELKTCRAKIPGGRYGQAISRRSYNAALKAARGRPKIAELFEAKLRALGPEVDGVIVGKTKGGKTQSISVEKAIETILQCADPGAPYRVKRQPKP